MEESGGAAIRDMQETCEKFISLKCQLRLYGFQAGDGYIRHDLHADLDLPVEIITTDSVRPVQMHFCRRCSKNAGKRAASLHNRTAVTENGRKEEVEPI